MDWNQTRNISEISG